MKKSVCIFIILFEFCFKCPAYADEPVKIAAIFAMTGIAAHYNTDFFKGCAIAVKEINEKGESAGRTIELIEIDNKSTLLGAKQAAARAVMENVTAVIGSSWSSHSLAIAPVLQKAGIIMITPASTNPKVTLVGDYIFRVCFIDSFQGKVMAHFAYKDIKAENAAVLINVSSHYSIDLAEFFKKSFTDMGGKILWEGKYKENSVEFSEILEPLRSYKPHIVFIPGYANDSALIIKQAAAMGIKTCFLGGDGWYDNMYDFGGGAVEGGYYCTQWHPGVPFARSRKLIKQYKEIYGGEIKNFRAPASYDAVMILAKAIERAGSSNRAKIRDALAAEKNFQGATGNIGFDHNRNPINKSAVILKFENSSSVFVKIFPHEDQ